MENSEHIQKPIDGKSIAIISYLTFIGLIIALLLNSQNKISFAAYHIRQSIGLMLTALVSSFINLLPIVGWLLYIPILVVLMIMWFRGLMNAINHKEQPLPFLGERYSDWFKNL